MDGTIDCMDGTIDWMDGTIDCRDLNSTRQSMRHNCGRCPAMTRHGVWEFWKGGEKGVGAELEIARIAGAGPIQWA
ncbi:unnamed protein product [Merluccius merluccius]